MSTRSASVSHKIHLIPQLASCRIYAGAPDISASVCSSTVSARLFAICPIYDITGFKWLQAVCANLTLWDFERQKKGAPDKTGEMGIADIWPGFRPGAMRNKTLPQQRLFGVFRGVEDEC